MLQDVGKLRSDVFLKVYRLNLTDPGMIVLQQVLKADGGPETVVPSLWGRVGPLANQSAQRSKAKHRDVKAVRW